MSLDVLDVEEDNIPSASTERCSRRRVNGIHIPRTLVRYVHLPLSTPIERVIRTATADRQLGGVAALVAALNTHVSCIGHLMLHGTPSLHTFYSFSATLQRRRSSAYKWPAL